MISVIVYGRNDNHGYNYHKRAALSLNCLAQLLGADDELIFVDYNSPDDGPTFPEAIQDTLTSWTRERLRVLRARGAIHRRYRDRTRLPVVEPVARNIALRRSDPANRWILSTNTDIVLVPRHASSLAEIVNRLSPGLYHTARFEVPETMWEGLDRMDPGGTIETISRLGISARLNEVVYSGILTVYDGPGDFQLTTRADLFELDGFEENMLLGWHVDSNLAKRLSLKYGAIKSLLGEIYCYHCSHTRQATFGHSRQRTENSWSRFIEEVSRSDRPGQRECWGCPEDDIEEIRLRQGRSYTCSMTIDDLLPPLASSYSEAFLTPGSYNSFEYDPWHTLPFVANLLTFYPSNTQLAWCGVRSDMLDLLYRACRSLGFRRRLIVEAQNSGVAEGWPATDQLELVTRDEWLTRAEVLIFEFGKLAGGPNSNDKEARDALASVCESFLQAVGDEHQQLRKGRSPRMFIGINCIHNDTEALFQTHVGIMATTFASHVRFGYVVAPDQKVLDLWATPGAVLRLQRQRDALAAGFLEGAERTEAAQHRRVSSERDAVIAELLRLTLDLSGPLRSMEREREALTKKVGGLARALGSANARSEELLEDRSALAGQLSAATVEAEQYAADAKRLAGERDWLSRQLLVTVGELLASTGTAERHAAAETRLVGERQRLVAERDAFAGELLATTLAYGKAVDQFWSRRNGGARYRNTFATLMRRFRTAANPRSEGDQNLVGPRGTK